MASVSGEDNNDQNTAVTRIAALGSQPVSTPHAVIIERARTKCDNRREEQHVQELKGAWPSLQRISLASAQRKRQGLHARGPEIRKQSDIGQ